MKTQMEQERFSVPLGPKAIIPSRVSHGWDVQKLERTAIKDMIDALIAKGGYDSLERDTDDLRSVFVEKVKQSSSMTDSEAQFIVPMVLRVMREAVWDTDWREGRGKTKPDATTPHVAALLVISAIELVENAISPAGMRSYRNRHADFLSAMAAFAEQANGALSANITFYERLGKLVAQKVLDHKLAGAEPKLAPNGADYAQIEQVALEQLVYFVQAGDEGPIKIGIARDPASRISGLQTGHFETLHIRCIVPGGAELEREYHQRFSEHRRRGEWFEPAPAILAEIDRLKDTPNGH